MASELSTFIEKELKSKGYNYDEEDPDNPHQSLMGHNPHQSLMGALRVEVGAPAAPCTARAAAIAANITCRYAVRTAVRSAHPASSAAPRGQPPCASGCPLADPRPTLYLFLTPLLPTPHAWA
jgi:hypothetical protein